jgi:hypothetical protein
MNILAKQMFKQRFA